MNDRVLDIFEHYFRNKSYGNGSQNPIVQKFFQNKTDYPATAERKVVYTKDLKKMFESNKFN